MLQPSELEEIAEIYRDATRAGVMQAAAVVGHAGGGSTGLCRWQ